MIGGEMEMLLSDMFNTAMWKTNLSLPCNKMQYVLSGLKRGEQWNDKMQEQTEEAKYVLRVMIVVAKRVGLDQKLTPDEAEIFGGKWAAAKEILDVFKSANIDAEYLLARCSEVLSLVDELLKQHELPNTYYNWLKACFHWLGEPFLLSAHADLAAQRDGAPFSGQWPLP